MARLRGIDQRVHATVMLSPRFSAAFMKYKRQGERELVKKNQYLKLLGGSAEVVTRPACVISSGGPIGNAMFIGMRWRCRGA